jgi:hypothetical protein
MRREKVRELREVNPLNAELNPICHLLALAGAHHFVDVNRIRVNNVFKVNEEIAHNKLISRTRHTELRKISKFLLELKWELKNRQLKKRYKVRRFEGGSVTKTNTLFIG